jgi:hypothetical protein
VQQPSDDEIIKIVAGHFKGYAYEAKGIFLDMVRETLARFGTRPAAEPSQSGSAGEMPEPAFKLRWHAQDARYTVSKPNIGDTDVYTADQMRAALSRQAPAKERS